MHQKLKRYPEAGVLTAVVVAGGLFFSLSNPQSIPPAMFILAFALLLVGLYAALRLAGRLTGLKERMRPFRYNGLLIGGTVLPVMLLALQSIGQLTLRDALILITLFLAGYFYISRLYGGR